MAFGLPLFAFSQKTVAVTGVSITVEDLDREVDFFTKILDFQKINEETWTGEEVAKLFGLAEKTAGVQIVTLQLGSEKIRLMDFDDVISRPIAAGTRSNDLWFQHLAIVVSDMDAAYKKLLKNKVVHVSTAPQTLPEYLHNAAGIKAFYFRDPEGHNLELIWFPAGKGAAKWQLAALPAPPGGGENVAPISSPIRDSVECVVSLSSKAGSEAFSLPPGGPGGAPRNLFLGIDHTAIGIADTDSSMAFYRDALGLVHGGHSENYGTEQEHLNQVFGARLDINGLHADAGFGVEFLRYIAPPGGRPYPADSRATDLWHYQTELEVDDLPKMLEKLEKQGFTKISSTVAKIGSVEMFLVRDPDGHAVLLTSEFQK